MSLQGVNTVQLQGTRLIASADTGDYENDIEQNDMLIGGITPSTAIVTI